MAWRKIDSVDRINAPINNRACSSKMQGGLSGEKPSSSRNSRAVWDRGEPGALVTGVPDLFYHYCE